MAVIERMKADLLPVVWRAKREPEVVQAIIVKQTRQEQQYMAQIVAMENYNNSAGGGILNQLWGGLNG